MVRQQEIAALRHQLSAIQTEVGNARTRVAQINTNLMTDPGWRFSGQQRINDRLDAVARRLQAQAELMRQYTGFLDTVNDRFSATDRDLRNQASGVIYQAAQIAQPMISRCPHSGILYGSGMGKIAAIAGMFGGGMLSADPRVTRMPPDGTRLGLLSRVINTGGGGVAPGSVIYGNDGVLQVRTGTPLVGGTSGSMMSVMRSHAYSADARISEISFPFAYNAIRFQQHVGGAVIAHAANVQCNWNLGQRLRGLTNMGLGGLAILGGFKFPPLAIYGGMKFGDGTAALLTGREQNSLRDTLNFVTGNNRAYYLLSILSIVTGPKKLAMDSRRSIVSVAREARGAAKVMPAKVGLGPHLTIGKSRSK